MGVREVQKEKRRQQILEAGLELFIRKGYAATKVSDIAQRVGMSVGLMFHYFDSKERLYEELIRFGVGGPMNMMTAVDDREPLRFFEKAASDLLGYLKSDSFGVKMFVLMSQAFYNEAAPQGARELLRGFDIYTPTARLIQKGQAQGTIRSGDPTALGIAFWCAIQGIAEQMAMNPQLPCPESDWIVDILRRKSQ